MVRRSESRRTSLIGNLLVAAFAVIGVWGIGLIKFDGVIPKSLDDGHAQTEAIVVLTGGSGRLDAGLDLLMKNPNSRLFVSGVYKGNEVRHLLKLSNLRPVDLGSRIAIGNAVNTRENAAETAVWVESRQINSLRLVTAAYHMPRSLSEFRHKLPDVKIVAHPVFPQHVKQDRWWLFPGTAALVIGEYNKFILAWVRQLFETWFDEWRGMGQLFNGVSKNG